MLCEEATAALDAEYLDKTAVHRSDDLSQHLTTCRNCRGRTTRLNNILKSVQWEKMATPEAGLIPLVIADGKSRCKAVGKSRRRRLPFAYAAVFLIPLMFGVAVVARQKAAAARGEKPPMDIPAAPSETARQETDRLIFGGKNPIAEYLPFPELAVADAASDRKKAVIAVVSKAPPEIVECPNNNGAVNFTARFASHGWSYKLNDGSNEISTPAEDKSPARQDLTTTDSALVQQVATTAPAGAGYAKASRRVIYSPDILDALAEFSPAVLGSIIGAEMPSGGGFELSGAIGNFTAGMGPGTSALSGMGSLGGMSGVGSGIGSAAGDGAGWGDSREQNSRGMMSEELNDFVSVNFATETPPTWETASCRMSGS